jgi:hypothetical protein
MCRQRFRKFSKKGLAARLRTIARNLRQVRMFRPRVGNIAVWNSAMDEHNYLVRRWNEFLSA